MRRWEDTVRNPGLVAERLLDQAEVAIVVTDRDGRLRYVNRSAIRLFRWSGDVANLLGRSLLGLGFADGDREKLAALAGDVLLGRTWDGLLRGTRAETSLLCVRAYAAPLREAAGSIDGIIVVAWKARGHAAYPEPLGGGRREEDGGPAAGDRARVEPAPGEPAPNGTTAADPGSSDTGLYDTGPATALTFQKSLLPRQLPLLDGFDVAYRYVPACSAGGQSASTNVGGDWYDIIPLAAGRVGFAVGDVAGRGVAAAAIMGQLRTALRAFAQDEQAPADILRKLDQWCRSMADDSAANGSRRLRETDHPIASCMYLVYDPWSRELSYASAGHDAPLLVVDGDVRRLEIRNKGALLGAPADRRATPPSYKEEALILPTGAALILYTDGLTDRRTCRDGSVTYTEEESVGMLCRAIRSLAVTDDAAAMVTAVENAIPGALQDDMVILAVRTSPRALPSRQWSLPAEPVMVSEARRMTRQVCEAWGMAGEQRELTSLLVSEVVTNAVVHASVTPGPRRRAPHGLVTEITTVDGAATENAVVDTEKVTMDGAEVDSAAMAGPLLAVPVAAATASGPRRGAASGVEATVRHRQPVAADVRPVGPRQICAGPAAERTSRALQDIVADPTPTDSPPRPTRNFGLRFRRGTAAVWVEVFDTDLRLPRLRSAGQEDEGGRGLYLVEQLAARWGSRPTRGGKAVWFEVPLRGDSQEQ